MVGTRLTLLIVFYVTLDFANPLMPGAVNFGADESIEGLTVQHHLLRQPFAYTTPALAPRLRESVDVPRAVTRGERAPVVREWIAYVRLAHSTSFDPPPLIEDH